jgi:hypothetical protein
MIERVVVGMASYGWGKRLARDVLMNICQRRCQNIGRRENEERRRVGQEIKLGRPKTIQHTDYETPMDFVSAMKAVPEVPSVTIQAKPTQEPQHLSEIVGSAKQYQAKLGLIPSNPQTNQVNSGKRKQLKAPESRPRRAAPFANISAQLLSHPPPLPSSSRPLPVPSGSRPSPIPSAFRPSPVPSASHPRLATARPTTTVDSNQTISAFTSQARSPLSSVLVILTVGSSHLPL